MELSKKERLILVNHYDILSRLADGDYEKKKFENLREIFSSGYTRLYSEATEYLYEELDKAECKFVVDVLNLYTDLYHSRERNDQAKESIDEDEVLFKGFDANDSIQSRYYGLYKFYVEDLGRYCEYEELVKEQKIEYNSHGFGPSMDRLSKMIVKHKEIKNRHADKLSGIDGLTLEEIQEIISQ